MSKITINKKNKEVNNKKKWFLINETSYKGGK